MSFYLLYGLIGGGLCSAICVILVAAAKKTPELAQTVEILISAIGISGGVKIFVFVFGGRLAAALKDSADLTQEDTAYFLIGALALIWVSLQVILKQMYGSWSSYKQTTNPPGPPTNNPPAPRGTQIPPQSPERPQQ